MIMNVAYLLLAAVSQTAAQPPVIVPVISTPVPPPIISAPVSPPVIMPIAPSPPRMPRADTPPIVVDIKVLAGTQVLYSDTLHVDGYAGAGYSQSRSEASSLTCPLALFNGRSRTNSLNVRLGRRNFSEDEQAISVDINWNRPSPDATCESSGSRQANLSQVVKLTPGKSVRIDGDAGLRVEIRQH
jgi:hypothetical protein